MKPRCQGAKTPGHFTGFICVLDDGHDGFCQPYQAPTVDEWRELKSRLDKWVDIAGRMSVAVDAALDREKATNADCARLQAELDALRASIAPEHFTCPDCGPHQKSDEDGCCATCGADLGIFPCDDCAHGTPKHPASQEATLAEMRGALDDDEPERTDP